MLAILQKSDDGLYVFDREFGLSSNIWFLVAAALKALDIMKQVDGSMLAPSEIFNQAHDFTVFGRGDHHESRNLGLAECLISFQPALAANQFIAWSIRSVVFGDADGPLEA